MFCGGCGAETNDQANFCPACGHNLTLQKVQLGEATESTPSTVTISYTSDSRRSGFWRRFAAYVIDVVIVWLALDIVWGTVVDAIGYGYGYGIFGLIDGPFVLFPYFFLTPTMSHAFTSVDDLSDLVYSLAYPETWLYVGASTLIPLAAVLAYYVGTTTVWGHTLGKAALGIRVLGPDGAPPGIGRALVRETLGKFLSTIFWIGFLMAAGKQKRGLHDRISGTEVEISTPNWRKHNNLTRKDA